MNTSFPDPNTKQRGDAAEQRALRYLLDHGLTLLACNYRTPGRGGGEIDLIVRDDDGTLVFVEVRSRTRDDFGGAGASISAASADALCLRPNIFCAGTQHPRHAALMRCCYKQIA